MEYDTAILERENKVKIEATIRNTALCPFQHSPEPRGSRPEIEDKSNPPAMELKSGAGLLNAWMNSFRMLVSIFMVSRKKAYLPECLYPETSVAGLEGSISII